MAKARQLRRLRRPEIVSTNVDSGSGYTGRRDSRPTTVGAYEFSLKVVTSLLSRQAQTS